jgi:hypothetical protein
LRVRKPDSAKNWGGSSRSVQVCTRCAWGSSMASKSATAGWGVACRRRRQATSAATVGRWPIICKGVPRGAVDPERKKAMTSGRFRGMAITAKLFGWCIILTCAIWRRGTENQGVHTSTPVKLTQRGRGAEKQRKKAPLLLRLLLYQRLSLLTSAFVY